MIDLKWSCFADADCDAFRVYRSIPGIIIDFPNGIVNGTEWRFQATSPTVQTITFLASDIDSVLSKINDEALGLKAAKSASGNQLLIRLTATEKARLKLLPCDFLTATSQTARLIVPKLEWTLLDSVIREDEVFDYEYEDVDGDPLDSYRVTSFKALDYLNAPESLPSITKAPVIPAPPLCVLEGRVITRDNRPLRGVLVQARPYLNTQCVDSAGIGQMQVEVKTDGFGRFSLHLLQNQVYLLEIPAIGYTEKVAIPEAEWARMIDASPTTLHWFNPGAGDPV